jgi:hypothetical protein
MLFQSSAGVAQSIFIKPIESMIMAVSSVRADEGSTSISRRLPMVVDVFDMDMVVEVEVVEVEVVEEVLLVVVEVVVVGRCVVVGRGVVVTTVVWACAGTTTARRTGFIQDFGINNVEAAAAPTVAVVLSISLRSERGATGPFRSRRRIMTKRRHRAESGFMRVPPLPAR